MRNLRQHKNSKWTIRDGRVCYLLTRSEGLDSYGWCPRHGELSAFDYIGDDDDDKPEHKIWECCTCWNDTHRQGLLFR